MTEKPDPVAAALGQLLTPHNHADPYPLYAQWRALRPVALLGDTFAMISGHPEAVEVLRSPDFGHAEPEKITDDPSSHDPDHPVDTQGRVVRAFVSLNPPDHTRLRRLVSKAFTSRTVERLTPRIQELADELIDQALDRGELDLMEAIARPLPIAVIAELLGVPMADRDHLTGWSAAMTRAIDPGFLLPPGAFDAAATARRELISYFRELVVERRRRPGGDLLSALVTVSDRGNLLSEGELLVTINTLLFAGHETTTNLIGNGALALLRHSEQYAALADGSADAGDAIEEILRYDSPVQMTRRIVLTDTAAGQVELKAGTTVVVLNGAANHDPRLVDTPEVFDITRTPVKHLALGHGIHFCLGAPLARIEGRVVLGSLARRAPKSTLVGEPQWGPTATMRGLNNLPVDLK